MRYLVTGAGGYIGSVLVPQLLNQGNSVFAVDTFIFGDTLPDHPRLTIVKTDVRDIFHYGNAWDWDAAIDLAAISNDPAGELDPAETWHVNYDAAFRTAKWAKEKSRIPRYVFASSCSVYGSSNGVLDERSELNPISTYSKAKAAAEKDILALTSDNFYPAIARQATVFGVSPRMRFDLVINTFARDLFLKNQIKIMGEGEQQRPFIHVQDTANALIWLTQAILRPTQIFNVGANWNNFTIDDVLYDVVDALGVDAFSFERISSPDIRSYKVDFSLIESYGWEAKKTVMAGAYEVYEALKDGMLDPHDPKTITVDWYKKLKGPRYA